MPCSKYKGAQRKLCFATNEWQDWSGTCKKSKELAIGKKIEMEHASLFPKKIQHKMAKKIAEQHIAEFPCYYTKGLVPMESKLKKLKGGKKKDVKL